MKELITDQVSYWQGMQEQVEIILRVKEEIAPISCLISQDSPDERELQKRTSKNKKEAIKRMNRLPAAYRPLVDKEWQTIEISVNQAISWAHYKKDAQKQSLFTRLRKLICRKAPHSAQLDNHSLPVDQSCVKHYPQGRFFKRTITI